jgi:hypothetical protein
MPMIFIYANVVVIHFPLIGSAGYTLPGLVAFPTLESQRQRFTDNGWAKALDCTMLEAYNLIISSDEKQRLGKLEMLDEIEEWQLLMSHYSISIAINSKEASPHLEKLSQLLPVTK